jgi:type II secretory pathway pseudopilin PulG
MRSAFRPAGAAPIRRRRNLPRGAEPCGGFSLIEVVFAIGLLAVGILSVIGFFPVMEKTIAGSSETDAAVQIVAPLIAQLQSLPFDTVLACLKTSGQVQSEDNDPSYNPAQDVQLFYANRSGERIGRRGDAAWGGTAAGRFFEITLIRNEDLSPTGSDDLAPWMGFTIRLRWPLFFADTPADPRQMGASIDAPMKIDRSQQSTLLLAGSLRR